MTFIAELYHTECSRPFSNHGLGLQWRRLSLSLGCIDNLVITKVILLKIWVACNLPSQASHGVQGREKTIGTI